MAQLTRTVQQPAKKAIVASTAKTANRPAIVSKPAAKPATVATKTVKQTEDLTVYDMSSIDLLPKGGGGGRAMSPFAERCLSLEIGQGVRISEEKYKGGKGVASLYAAANRRGMKFRVRKDREGGLWLFRIEKPEEEQVTEE